MITHPSRVLWLCATALALGLSGCGTVQLKPVPPRNPPQLAGHWTLDPANSEPIDAAVNSLEAQLRGLAARAHPAAGRAAQPPSEPRRHERRPAQNGGASAGAPAGTDAGDANAVEEPSVEVSAPRLGAGWVREFIAHVPVGDYLGIGMAPGLVTVRSAAGSQQCSLGVPTAITFGDSPANETCGWDGQAFIIEILPLIGPRLTERFALAPDGELAMTLHLSGHGIDVRLIRRYRRNPHAVPPVLLPTSD
jgi:hypothetical protein